MKKILIVLILGCSPGLSPNQVLEFSRRCYQELAGYHDRLLIYVTRIENGAKTTYKIEGETYFKPPGELLLKFTAPREFVILLDDSISCFDVKRKIMIKYEKPERVGCPDFPISRFINDQIPFVVINLLLSNRFTTLKKHSSIHYLGTRLEKGRMVYQMVIDNQTETIRFSVDCKSGMIHMIDKESQDSASGWLQVREKYQPWVNYEISDSIFNFDCTGYIRQDTL